MIYQYLIVFQWPCYAYLQIRCTVSHKRIYVTYLWRKTSKTITKTLIRTEIPMTCSVLCLQFPGSCLLIYKATCWCLLLIMRSQNKNTHKLLQGVFLFVLVCFCGNKFLKVSATAGAIPRFIDYQCQPDSLYVALSFCLARLTKILVKHSRSIRA